MTTATRPKQNHRIMGRGAVITCGILTLLTPLGLLLIRLAKGSPAIVEQYYSRGWYHAAATALTAVTGKLPFSAMEAALILLGVLAVLFLAGWVRELLRRQHRWWQICLKRLWIAASAVSVIFFWFILTGDLNYYRVPGGESLGLQTEETGVETLRALCHLLAQEAGEARALCTEDAQGVFASAVSYQELAEQASSAVAGLDEACGVQLFDLAKRTRPKAMHFSEVMSYLQLTGVIFPYLSEPNVNVHQPAYGISSTMCHELSHICGFMREDEANFIAYIACRGSQSAELRYSGAMLALIHATNRLYRYDPNGWQEIYSLLPEGVLRDLSYNHTYWRKYETPVGETADRWNDAYLKANDQTDGVQSYGRMVDLLIAYYRAEGRI